MKEIMKKIFLCIISLLFFSTAFANSLESRKSKISKLSDEDIKQYQSAVVSRLLKKDNTLYQRSNRNWQEIDTQNFDFNTKSQLADLVQKFTPTDVRTFFSSLIKQKGNALLVYTSSKSKQDKIPDTLAPLEKKAKFSHFSNKE
mgnify:CR=1 FL=1